jgi:hypothetical protein
MDVNLSSLVLMGRSPCLIGGFGRDSPGYWHSTQGVSMFSPTGLGFFHVPLHEGG